LPPEPTKKPNKKKENPSFERGEGKGRRSGPDEEKMVDCRVKKKEEGGSSLILRKKSHSLHEMNACRKGP